MNHLLQIVNFHKNKSLDHLDFNINEIINQSESLSYSKNFEDKLKNSINENKIDLKSAKNICDEDIFSFVKSN